MAPGCGTLNNPDPAQAFGLADGSARFPGHAADRLRADRARPIGRLRVPPPAGAARPRQPSRARDQRGALMISLIVTMTLVALLGGAMVYLTATSGAGSLNPNSRQQAYYLALAGLKLYDAQAVKPELPQTYTLDNGDRILLASGGLPERLSSTGIVQGAFGEVRVRLTSRGSAGSPAWVDTMENLDNWLGAARIPGTAAIEAVEGNRAMRTGGEAVEALAGGASAPLEDLVSEARAVRDDYRSQRDSTPPASAEWWTLETRLQYWEAVLEALEGARSVLESHGVVGASVTLPADLFKPQFFGVYLWRQADGGNPVPLFDYWRGTSYDGTFHEANTLSYDLQVKSALLPPDPEFLTGISLRVDASRAVNGGDLLGVSLVRGVRGGALPDRLVPEDDPGRPAVMLWLQQDRNGDGLITPLWEYTVPPAGPTLTLWPEEREILAYAELPADYCLLQPDNRCFHPWTTLMVRLEERRVAVEEAGGGLDAGDKVNAVKVFLSTVEACNGGGSLTGDAADLLLDNRRGGSTRLPPLSPFINWPVVDPNNLRVGNDLFSLAGGGLNQIDWTFVAASPSPVHGVCLHLTGGQPGRDADAVLLIDARLTAGYGNAIEDWPAEIGLHAMGLEASEAAAVYFDDFAVRLKGREAGLR